MLWMITLFSPINWIQEAIKIENGDSIIKCQIGNSDEEKIIAEISSSNYLKLLSAEYAFFYVSENDTLYLIDRKKDLIHPVIGKSFSEEQLEAFKKPSQLTLKINDYM